MAKGMGLSCQHLTQIAQEACAPASRAEGAGLPQDGGFFHGACSGLFRGPPPHPLRASAGAGFCGT